MHAEASDHESCQEREHQERSQEPEVGPVGANNDGKKSARMSGACDAEETYGFDIVLEVSCISRISKLGLERRSLQV